ncbi:MAG: hypothetical protein II368_06430, partial [Clostridia bacterium]|nr:hypothetical protein [Clostridia bacterium]
MTKQKILRCVLLFATMLSLMIVGTSSVTVLAAEAYDSTTVAVIGNEEYSTLTDAVSAAQDGDTITLTATVKMIDILTINKGITLDGNGNTLLSTAERAINVSGATGVTIKNLTIQCTGERAINVIQNSTNVTIDHVIATANNYTVNVASSAPNATVSIVSSTLIGKNVVNVAAVGANITIALSEVCCNDDNATEGESYAALCLGKEATGATITANDSSIFVSQDSDSMQAKNSALNGQITIDG